MKKRMSSVLSMARFSLVMALVGLFQVVSANAQDGTYNVSESWRVTVTVPPGYPHAGVFTRSGVASGTVTVANGSFQLINKTGANTGNSSGHLQYDSFLNQYSATSGRVAYAFASGPAGFYVVAKLSFFVVLVPLESDFGFSLFSRNDTYTAHGSSLSSLQGSGTAIDGNGLRFDMTSTSKLMLPNATLPRFTSQPASQIALPGNDVSFSVAATGIPAVSYQWQFAESNLHDDGKFSGTTTPTLSITGVEASNAGTYTVVASNAKGSVTSAKAALTIGATITAQASGGGKITPDYNGKILPIGTKYTLTATPNKGCLFAGWSGSIPTNTPILAFTLRSNVVVQATFVTNQFLASQGTYNGLFAPANADRQQTNSGFITLTVQPSGAFSGKLLIGQESVSLSGQLNAAGSATAKSVRPRKNTLLTSLQMDFSNQQVTGTITDGNFTAQLQGDRAVFSKVNKASSFAGQYTFILPGSPDQATAPRGPSYGTVTVDSTGKITMAGSLADGTPVSQSSTVSKDGFWPLYASLNSGSGSLYGWACLTNHSLLAAPNLSWISVTNSTKTALYRRGFSNPLVEIVGSTFASTNRPVLDVNNGTLSLTDGNLPQPLTVRIVSSKNVIRNAPAETNRLSLTMAPATGLITGTFTNMTAVPKQVIKLKGVILQNQTKGIGYFLGSTESGTMEISAPRP